MRPITVQVGPLAAAVANNIALSQSPGAGAVTLNGSTVTGGVATLDVARRVIFTSGGNDSGITFTINGTNWAGNPISETLAGGNVAAAQTVLDYKTVTSVSHTGTVAGTLTIGTNGVASSPWARLDDYGFAQVALQVDVSGTVSYTVETSMDDPNLIAPQTPVAPAAMVWIADPNLTTQSASKQDAIVARPLWGRVTLLSGSGSASAVFSQAGAKTG